MATAVAAPQTNGIPPASQTIAASQSQQSQDGQAPGSASQQIQSQQQNQQQHQQNHPSAHPLQASSNPYASGANPLAPTSPSAPAPRPRDGRTLELLLTAQGVTAFEPRVPLLLLDFAYRHTSSILSDALHLSADPYTTHAGARPSATSGAAPVNAGDAAVTASAVQLAIASRLGYQFRGGGGAASAGGGVSKDWMMELARERNRVALPRVPPAEWGVRLPSERFVLSGVGWGLRDAWAGMGDDMDDDDDDDDDEGEGEGGDGGGAMEGVENTGENAEDVGGDGVEGGTVDDMFGDDAMEEDLEAE